MNEYYKAVRKTIPSFKRLRYIISMKTNIKGNQTNGNMWSKKGRRKPLSYRTFIYFPRNSNPYVKGKGHLMQLRVSVTFRPIILNWKKVLLIWESFTCIYTTNLIMRFYPLETWQIISVYCCKDNKYLKYKHHWHNFKWKKMNRLPDFLCFCFPKCIVSKDYVERDMKRDHTSETTKLH